MSLAKRPKKLSEPFRNLGILTSEGLDKTILTFVQHLNFSMYPKARLYRTFCNYFL